MADQQQVQFGAYLITLSKKTQSEVSIYCLDSQSGIQYRSAADIRLTHINASTIVAALHKQQKSLVATINSANEHDLCLTINFTSPLFSGTIQEKIPLLNQNQIVDIFTFQKQKLTKLRNTIAGCKKSLNQRPRPSRPIEIEHVDYRYGIIDKYLVSSFFNEDMYDIRRVAQLRLKKGTYMVTVSGLFLGNLPAIAYEFVDSTNLDRLTYDNCIQLPENNSSPCPLVLKRTHRVQKQQDFLCFAICGESEVEDYTKVYNVIMTAEPI